MSQISRPFQILLGAVAVFAVAWFLFLKPSDDDGTVASTPAPAAQAPGVKGLTTAVNKAKATKTAADKQATDMANADPGTTTTATKPVATTPATPGATTTKRAVTPAGPVVKDPARDSGDPADGLLDKLTGDRVVVLLFAGNGSDDLAAMRAVRTAGRGNPRTIVRVTSMRNVGKYATITDKLGINQAPSAIIIGSDLQAQVLTGIIDAKAVEQYVGDARRRANKSK